MIGTKEGSGTVTTTIPEGTAAGASTGITLVATGTGTITYTIDTQPTMNKLTLATEGLLSLGTGQSFDYATEPTYTFTVK